MDKDLLDEFLCSEDTFRVFKHDELVFSSKMDRILPLLDYIDHYASHLSGVTMFDRVVGNAAALLSVKAHCSVVYSPLGSQLAVETLDKYDIGYHITRTIPYILKKDISGMCPMEKLSIDKDPDSFYLAIKAFISNPSSLRHI